MRVELKGAVVEAIQYLGLNPVAEANHIAAMLEFTTHRVVNDGATLIFAELVDDDNNGYCFNVRPTQWVVRIRSKESYPFSTAFVIYPEIFDLIFKAAE